MKKALLVAILFGLAAPAISNASDILGFEKNGCKDYCGRFFVARGNFACDKKNERTPNDEIRSVRLRNVPAGTRIIMFDDPNGKQNDDYIVIEVLRNCPAIDLPTLEKSVVTANVKATYYHKNGLDGKVSCVRIIPPIRIR